MASDPAPIGPAQAEPAISEPPRVAEPQSQRVRVGMLGLASVFLLVMLVTAILSLANDNRAPGNQAAANASEVPREPLAELGVAPGNPPAVSAPTKPQAR